MRPTAEKLRELMPELNKNFIDNQAELIINGLMPSVLAQAERMLYEASYKLEAGFNRTAVAKAIEKLKELGYDVKPFGEHDSVIYLSWEEK